MWSRRKLVLVSISATALITAGLTACGNSEDNATFAPAKTSRATVAITPESGAEKAPISTEIGITVTEGQVAQVEVTTDAGDQVSGDLRPDGSAWVPAEPLKPKTTYTATVEVLDDNKVPATTSTSFTTMAKPKERMSATLWNKSGYEYGNAMPIMIDFPDDFEVPEKHRAEVEKRLFVYSDPPQQGAWHWFTGNHLEYRPEQFWEPGTSISVRAALDGVPLGGDKYGEKDITETVAIDSDTRVVEIVNKDKEMVAKKNGKVVKTMPISLGKASTPSYSGTMTIMEQMEHTVFDTTAECGGQVQGDNCYRTPVDWAQRLTWSGQFIHSAPWSVGDQGVRNVSHGCVNASPSDSKWIYDFAKIGDPVVITGTEEDLPYGDGFTAFDMSWEDFLQGSYLHKAKSNDDSKSDASGEKN